MASGGTSPLNPNLRNRWTWMVRSKSPNREPPVPLDRKFGGIQLSSVTPAGSRTPASLASLFTVLTELSRLQKIPQINHNFRVLLTILAKSILHSTVWRYSHQHQQNHTVCLALRGLLWHEWTVSCGEVTGFLGLLTGYNRQCIC